MNRTKRSVVAALVFLALCLTLVASSVAPPAEQSWAVNWNSSPIKKV